MPKRPRTLTSKVKKKGVLLVTKILLNLGNDLKSFSRPLGKVIKPLIALVGFQGVELGELLGSRGSFLAPRTTLRAQSCEHIHWASTRTSLARRSGRHP